jgi:DNA topoisomerase VI subunit A
MCVMVMVDWNPSGCYIACNYKFGNKKGTKQSTTCDTTVQSACHMRAMGGTQRCTGWPQ